MAFRNLVRDESKTALFFRSLLPFRSRRNQRIQVDAPFLSPDPTKPHKILVVDDDAVILKTVSAKFRAAGYDTMTATDGATAVRTIREENPDLMVLDINYPPEVSGVPWDGFVLMKWMRAMHQGQSVPVIFITNTITERVRQKAMECGASGLFEKPLDHASLLDFIEKILAGRAPIQSKLRMAL